MTSTSSTATTAADALAAKKPRRADALRNYEALVSAARDAFAEHGTDAALEDIARRAGVGIATLYRNFPSREDLVEAVYVDEILQLVAAGERAPDAEPWAALVQWLDRFAEYIGTKHVLIDGLNKDSETFQSCRVTMYSAGEPVLTRAQDAGLVRPDLTINDLIRLFAAIVGVSYDSDEQRRRIIDLGLEGIRTH